MSPSSLFTSTRPETVLMEEARVVAIRQAREIDPMLFQRKGQGGYANDNICGGTKEEIDRKVGEITKVQGEPEYSGTIFKVCGEVGMRPEVKRTE